jgi:hypothetical protein
MKSHGPFGRGKSVREPAGIGFAGVGAINAAAEPGLARQ